MPLFKGRTERFDGVLKFVRKYFSENEYTLVEQRVHGLNNAERKAVGDALSLGSRGDSSDYTTEHRNGLRTLLFLLFREGKQPVALASNFIARYESCPIYQLIKEIRSRIPITAVSPYRADWEPANFTDPKRHSAGRFRYIVFGMMNAYTGRGTSFDTILAQPSILKSYILSTSIIDQDHIPTYYPYGFIISAPADNILSAQRKDQAFKNYRVQDDKNSLSATELNDLTTEMRRVAATVSIVSPATILAETKTNADFGYNEVVVLGATPNAGTIDIVGMYMKVDSNGKRYFRKEDRFMGRYDKEPFVTDNIYGSMLATKLPIVELVDPSGRGG